jgi:hypothetical protein
VSTAPDGDRAGSRWTTARKWLAGVATSAVVIPLLGLAVSKAGDWFTSKVSPEQYLSAVVDVPSPQHTCISGEGWVFDTDPQHLPGVLPDEDKDAWAAANGGIPASGNIVQVTLQGLNGHTVVVTDISVEVVSRSDPPSGTYPYTGGQCGGMIPYRFQANLDAKPVSVTALADDGAVDPNAVRRPVDLPHSISGSEPEVWHIGAITDSCTCEWTATLNWNSEGTQGHTKITDNGRPFRVAATTHAVHVATDYRGGWGPAK